MYIDNQNHIFPYSILDAQDFHYTSFNEKTIQIFFNNIQITQDINSITSLYIQYCIPPFLFENNPQICFHFYPHIQKLIKQSFDYEQSYMMDDMTHTFFIVILNASREDIMQSFLSLQNYLSRKNFSHKHQTCHIDIRCGIYISHPFVHPIHIYHGAKKQFENTLQHHHSLLAIKP